MDTKTVIVLEQSCFLEPLSLNGTIKDVIRDLTEALQQVPAEYQDIAELAVDMAYEYGEAYPVVRVTYERPREPDEMTDWQDISTAPDRPMEVLFYSAKAQWHDSNGAPCDVPDNVRYDVGYWDDKQFFYAGTNHSLAEEWHHDTDFAPTEWTPLPKLPKEVK